MCVWGLGCAVRAGGNPPGTWGGGAEVDHLSDVRSIGRFGLSVCPCNHIAPKLRICRCWGVVEVGCGKEALGMAICGPGPGPGLENRPGLQLLPVTETYSPS